MYSLIHANEKLCYINPTEYTIQITKLHYIFSLHILRNNVIRFHFLIPSLKLLSDVDCLKCSGTNAQILAPKVGIDSTPKLLVLLFCVLELDPF